MKEYIGDTEIFIFEQKEAGSEEVFGILYGFFIYSG
jgi:hypothetical protein